MRIIKEITFFLKQKGGYNKEWIDWLEKLAPKPQGKSALETIKEEEEEEKEVDNAYKVETKFNIGDWIVASGKVLYKVIDIREHSYGSCYMLIDTDNNEYEYGIEIVEYDCRLWTIAYAEDGDVLVSRSPFIYGKQCPYGGLNWHNGNFIKASNFIFTDSPVHPATKEQRVLLFQKMKEAGYEWDADNKQLIKIIDYEEDNV